jgi:hypothetical protein
MFKICKTCMILHRFKLNICKSFIMRVLHRLVFRIGARYSWNFANVGYVRSAFHTISRSCGKFQTITGYRSIVSTRQKLRWSVFQAFSAENVWQDLKMVMSPNYKKMMWSYHKTIREMMWSPNWRFWKFGVYSAVNGLDKLWPTAEDLWSDT